MNGAQGTPGPACRCGVLTQHSWWHEVLENENYRVVRLDTVNSVAEVLTIAVASEPEARHPLFLTVADIDWPTLLANFAEPVATRNGEDAASLAHDKLLTNVRELLAANRDLIPTEAVG